MKILIVGATGATGKRLVKELLNYGCDVKVIVRTAEKFSKKIRYHKNISIITSTILGMSEGELAKHIEDCDAIVSCLGHNMNFHGIFGHPRRLVADSIHLLCQAIHTNNLTKPPVKVILMNTAGCRNNDLKEKISFPQLCLIMLLRILVPPHVDNEKAANYLRTMIGQNHSGIEWVAVRPDSLTEDNTVSTYTVHASPNRSIFNPGKSSRINVAHFMAELISDSSTWSEWKGQMPVIYNSEK